MFNNDTDTDTDTDTDEHTQEHEEKQENVETGLYNERDAPGDGIPDDRSELVNPAERDTHGNIDDDLYELMQGLTGVDEGVLVDLPAGSQSNSENGSIGQISKFLGEPGDENWLWRTNIHHKQLEYVLKLMYWNMYAPDATPVVNEFKKKVLPDLMEGLTSVDGRSRQEITEILSPLFSMQEINDEGEDGKRNTGAITFNYQNDE